MGLIGHLELFPAVCFILLRNKRLSPSISLVWFSLFSWYGHLFLTYKQSKLIDLLGYVLTPGLLFALGLIIFVGLIYPEAAPASQLAIMKLLFMV